MVAAWRDRSADFVLGAMLPDFATMAGARLRKLSAGSLADGIRFHHATDAVFHRLEDFRWLSRQTLARLGERGVARGSALAVAHVGIELLLDGELVVDAAAQRAYRAAVAAAPSASGCWQDQAHEDRWRQLAARLADWGVPTGYRDSDEVTRRLVRILRDRPRLRLREPDLERVRAELTEMQEQVAQRTPAIVAALRAELAPRQASLN